MLTSPVPAKNHNSPQVTSAPNPTNRTFPEAFTDDGPFPFPATFSQTTFTKRSWLDFTSNVGSHSPNRSRMRYLLAATFACLISIDVVPPSGTATVVGCLGSAAGLVPTSGSRDGSARPGTCGV